MSEPSTPMGIYTIYVNGDTTTLRGVDPDGHSFSWSMPVTEAVHVAADWREALEPRRRIWLRRSAARGKRERA